jgi:hypothetical protein
MAASLVFATPADATLALTPAGIADGFTLTTFATVLPGNTGCCAGPFGVAVNGQGNVVVGLGSGPLYVFGDTDGQTPASALFTQTTSSFVGAYAASGGVVYGATDGGPYFSLNSNGTVANANAFPGLNSFLGMWTNPVNGHIISNSTSGLVDIDPVANTFRVITGITGDGVSVSPDGKTAYSEVGGLIVAFDIVTGQLLATYNTSGSPDGTGVISGGQFNGFIIANTNNGNIDLINPTLNLRRLLPAAHAATILRPIPATAPCSSTLGTSWPAWGARTAPSCRRHPCLSQPAWPCSAPVCSVLPLLVGGTSADGPPRSGFISSGGSGNGAAATFLFARGCRTGLVRGSSATSSRRAKHRIRHKAGRSQQTRRLGRKAPNAVAR